MPGIRSVHTNYVPEGVLTFTPFCLAHGSIRLVQPEAELARSSPARGHMSLDVGEATRQLRKDKTAILQCIDGKLYYLRGINDHEAIGEPVDGGGQKTHLLESIRQVTDYDSDEDGLLKDPRVTHAKRQRVVASSSTSLTRSGSSSVSDGQPTACDQMLRMAFPFVSPHGTAKLEASLRLLEKYELVCQGDDYADPECLATNSEALQYARARAVVKGLTWSLGASLESRGRESTILRLEAEPYLGRSNATKIVDIFLTGTCKRSEQPAGPRKSA